MSKISFRIMFAILTCSLIIAVLVGGIGVYQSTNLLEKEATERVKNLSGKYAYEISCIFENIEVNVSSLSANVKTTFDINQFYTNPEEYISGYKAYLSPIIEEMTYRTDKINGIYFTFNPEFTHGIDEIWFARKDNQVMLMDATDNGLYLEAFNPPIEEQMYYYFYPIQKGHSVWTGPGYDPDSALNVISFSEAVYVDGVLIGVAGCDIDTKNTIDLIQNLEVYKTGYAFLLDEDYNFIIHPQYSKEENLKSVEGGIYGDAIHAMKVQQNGVVKYKDQKGGLQIIGFNHLTNGWIIAVVPPIDEVFKPAEELMISIILLTILGIGLSVIISYGFSSWFSKPIHSAVDELKHIGLEDFSHNISPEFINREDELGKVVKYTASIKELVEKKTKENREKDVILIEQSRLAKTGEMVGNIAHQWKQPLNNINLILANIMEAYRFNELDDEFLENAIRKTSNLTDNMSRTIEEFLDFVKPNKEKSWFSALASIDLALDFMEESIRYNQIRVILNRDTDIQIFGYVNEFSHAVFNLITNARDALLELPVNRRIEIIIEHDGETQTGTIKIINYGKIIEPEILKSIFTPFFTTKTHGKGTGIGLYISKNIIEQRINGKLEIANLAGELHAGVCCSIKIPGTRDRKEPENDDAGNE